MEWHEHYTLYTIPFANVNAREIAPKPHRHTHVKLPGARGHPLAQQIADDPRRKAKTSEALG